MYSQSVDVKNAEHCTPISSEVILSTCQPILISFLNGIDVVIETNKAFTLIYIKSVSVLVFFFFFFEHSVCKKAFDEAEGNMEKGENE